MSKNVVIKIDQKIGGVKEIRMKKPANDNYSFLKDIRDLLAAIFFCLTMIMGFVLMSEFLRGVL